jgi:hypothetical protein
VGVGGRGDHRRDRQDVRRGRRRSRAGIVARTLWWTHRSIFLIALRGLLAEEDREQLVVRLRVAADRAYEQLAGGLGEYGKGG